MNDTEGKKEIIALFELLMEWDIEEEIKKHQQILGEKDE